jgi:hypothetical protein
MSYVFLGADSVSNHLGFLQLNGISIFLTTSPQLKIWNLLPLSYMCFVCLFVFVVYRKCVKITEDWYTNNVSHVLRLGNMELLPIILTESERLYHYVIGFTSIVLFILWHLCFIYSILLWQELIVIHGTEIDKTI